MNAEAIAHLSRCDPVLAGLIRAVGEREFPEPEDCHPFQVLSQAIAHQQLNGTAANTILKRLIEGCGGGSFPTPQMVLDASVASLRAHGFSFAKVAALKDLAEKTLAAVVPDASALLKLSDDEIVERLTQVRGIGRWTVEMLLIFHLARPDVLPVDDFGVRAGFRAAYGLSRMPRPKALAAWGERWRPYRSTAAWYLWRAMELKRAGTLPPPAERIRLPRVRRLRRAARATTSGKRTARAARARTTKRTARAAQAGTVKRAAAPLRGKRVKRGAVRRRRVRRAG